MVSQPLCHFCRLTADLRIINQSGGNIRPNHPGFRATDGCNLLRGLVDPLPHLQTRLLRDRAGGPLQLRIFRNGIVGRSSSKFPDAEEHWLHR